MSQLRLGIPDYNTYYKPPDELLPRVDWNPPSAHEMPSWADAKRVGIDLECKDQDLRKLGPGVRREGNRVVGVGIAFEDGPDFYIPISHEGGDNADWNVWSYLQDQIKHFKGSLIGNGIGYDLDWLTENKCDVLSKSIMDVQVADPLINELHHKYDLNTLCDRHGLPPKDEFILREAANAYRIDPKKEMWKLPGRFVAAYGGADARRPLQILRRQERILDSEGLNQIWELEQKVTPILIKMRRRGVRVDLDHLTAIELMCLRTEAECLKEVKRLSGVEIAVGDVWKSEVLAHAVKKMGHSIPLTPKTKKPSIGNDFLEKKYGKVGASLMRAREWNKLRTTFCAQVRRAEINGRVHCTFNQLRATDDKGEGKGVRFGRLSSSNFNFQQQPIRNDEFGEIWRSVFMPDEGAQWACSDWSQQEPRIGVHYAEKLGLPGAKEFADEYRKNPSLDIHQKLADISGIPRKIVKNYVNGRLYGMGDAKLCRAIGKPTEMKEIRGETREVPGPEGQAMIDQFNRFAPWILGLTKAASKAAKKNGHVWTALRRRCNFEKNANGEWVFTHKAFSRVGQGSAADQMKATLVEADKEGIPIQAAVHDEFDFSFTELKTAKRVKELQMTVVQFSVPMKVDLEIGSSWGKLTKVTD